MRFTVKLSALLAMLLVGFSLLGGSGVGAQDMSTPEDSINPSDLEGIQNGAARYYTIDYSAMMDDMASPGADMKMPSGLIALGGAVIEFDNDDNAKSAFDQLKDDKSFSGDLAGDSSEDWDSGLGDQNKGFKGTEDIEGASMNTVFSMFQKDNYVYIALAAGSDVDVEGAAKDFGNKLIDNDGSGAGDFKEDGTSTGGLWDKFPKADDEQIANLIPSDEVIYPEAESTPAS